MFHIVIENDVILENDVALFPLEKNILGRKNGKNTYGLFFILI